MSERPRYETADDRKRETAIAERIGTLLKRRLIKLPLQYRLDYAVLCDDTFTAWVEIKRRFRTFEQYPDVPISLAKVLAARELHLVTNLPCRFFVQFDECLAHADLCKPNRAIAWWGRTDRDDWQDMEPAALIPMAEWRVIEAVAEPAGKASAPGMGGSEAFPGPNAGAPQGA